MLALPSYSETQLRRFKCPCTDTVCAVKEKKTSLVLCRKLNGAFIFVTKPPKMFGKCHLIII